MATVTKAKGLGPEDSVTNEAKRIVEYSTPYRAAFRIKGVSDLIYHRWNCDAVEAKANAAKGSKAKKSDDVQSYVYRDEGGAICMPGEYVRQSIITQAKSRQDPRSPRKSARDLVNAAVLNLTPLASHGITEWSYEHRTRVQVQRNAVTRVRPAISAGWELEFVFLVNLPEYITPDVLHELLTNAGRLIGVGDFRPTYGRFNVVHFEVIDADE